MTFTRAAAFVRTRLVYAVAAGVVVWGSWFVSLGIGGGRTDATGMIIGSDHLAVYTAAQFIRHDRAGELYDHEAFAGYQTGMFPPGVWQDTYSAYRHPPFYAYLFMPTAGLPYAASTVIWQTLGLAALAGCVFLLRPNRAWWTFAWALTYMPVFCAVSYGQHALLSCGVFAATYRLLAADRRFLAGFVAGLLWFKPTLLIGLFVWSTLDIRRLWPCWLGVIAAGAVLSLGSWLLVPEAWRGFVDTLAANARFDNFHQWKLHNPKGFWKLLLPTPIPLFAGLTLQAVLTLATIVAGLVVFVRLWRVRRVDLPVMFGAAIALTLWASPHTMIYEWALAVVPAVLWWTHVPDRRDAWVVLFAVAWVTLFVGTEIGHVQDWAGRRLGAEPPVVFQLSVPILGWVGWTAARMLRGDGDPLDAGRTGSAGAASPG